MSSSPWTTKSLSPWRSATSVIFQLVGPGVLVGEP
jgi:hypothetical protein